MTILRTTHADDVLAYLRPGDSFGKDVLILLNFSATALDVEPIDQLSRAVFNSLREPTDLLSGSPLRMPPRRDSIRVAASSAIVARSSTTR
jgi:hypothetical protein